MAKFDIKTVKPKFVVTTSPENKIDVVVNKPIITSKVSKSFFKLKNTGGPKGVKGDTGDTGAAGEAATIEVGQVETLAPNQPAYVKNVGTASAAIFDIGIPKGNKGDSGSGSGDMTASTYDPNGTVAAAGGIPDYVDSNGGKIDTIEVNGTPQTITNKTVDITVPTDTSDLTNGAGYITSSALPTVNDATLTITQNGVTAGTFTANASSNNTIALTDTTYSAMTGASSSTAGTSGLVPAPSTGDQNDVLKGDGTWGLIGTDNLNDFSIADTINTWMLVGVNGKIQHRVVKPFNADGSIPTSAIADGAVTTAKIADGAITPEKMAADGYRHTQPSGLTDANDLTDTGLYYLTEIQQNAPSTSQIYQAIVILAGDPGHRYGHQIFIDLWSNATYIRGCYDGSWGAWQQFH